MNVSLDPVIRYFSGLTLGKGYAHIGVLLTFVSFTGGGESGLITQYIGISQLYVDRAFYSGVAMIIGGTALYIWRISIESKERREGVERHTTPVSLVSLELARTLPPEGMTLQQITDELPPHPHDANRDQASAIGALSRSRIREVAKDGQDCYEEHGRYYSRYGDGTIIKG